MKLPPTLCRFLAAWIVVVIGTECAKQAQASNPSAIRSIVIVLEPQAAPAERLTAQVLKTRISDWSSVTIDIGAPKPARDLTIYLGKVRPQGTLSELCATNSIRPPGKSSPNPEGFAVKTIQDGDGRVLVAVGADDRGVLFAAGEILRQLHFDEDHVELSAIDLSTSPAFRFRGFSSNQGGTMMRATGARPWTADEIHNVVLDYALAGGNCFYTEDQPGALYQFVKSFSLMTTTGARPNQLLGPHPRQWTAGGRQPWEGNEWVCPSIPDAHAALRAQWEKDFARRADHDVMRFFAGDPGGCTDERCAPWGKTFVQLCEEMAGVWHKYHPNSLVMIANQGLDNAGDQAIFDYYNREPRQWSYGITYGPGSNALSHYFRDELRDDLLVYPGKGRTDRYLAEMLHALPIDQHIVHFSDITHWIRSQYQVDNPEPNIVKAYNRRMFHTRPRAMYQIFQQIMPFSEGDIIYSEGNHDEFHQYLWARLLWSPNRELEDAMREYCTLYFGAEAAEPMVQAMLQLEKNLVEPLDSNPGIARYYALVKQAGEKMPAWRLKRDYRWRLHMQKAALDQYLQLKLRIEMDREKQVRDLLGAAKPGGYDDAIKRALDILKSPLLETDQMKALWADAGRLGDDTNRLHGDRNIGYPRMKTLTLRNFGGAVALLDQAQSAKSEDEKSRLIQSVITVTQQRTLVGRRGQ
jgi:hypothetical protein